MILTRESVLHSGYFPGFFVFLVIFLAVTLYCTFRTVSLLLFFTFSLKLEITALFLVLGCGCLLE